MLFDIKLVDINPEMIDAWRATFSDCPDIQIVPGSMLKQAVSAWSTPTNAGGCMNGGLDLAIRDHFGRGIEQRVQAAIAEQHQGSMPVGQAVCVETGVKAPAFLISTPTMLTFSENVSATINVALAFAAVLQTATLKNLAQPGSITSIAIPGLGAATGGVPVYDCAEQMRLAYELMLERSFESFDALWSALHEALGVKSAGATSEAFDDLVLSGGPAWSGWYQNRLQN